MYHEKRHPYRVRDNSLGQEGITFKARRNYGLFDPFTKVCERIYPADTEGMKKAMKDAKDYDGVGSRKAYHIRYGQDFLYQPEGKGPIRAVRHGINDGTEKTDHLSGQAEFYNNDRFDETRVERITGSWMD